MRAVLSHDLLALFALFGESFIPDHGFLAQSCKVILATSRLAEKMQED